MSGNVFNYFALLTALVVGYGVWVANIDPVVTPAEVGELQGYYLRDAVITETSSTGQPHIRVAASEVTHDPTRHAIELTHLRIDYHTTAATPWVTHEPTEQPAASTHWVLNANHGVAHDSLRRIELRDEVEAHNLGSPHPIVLNTDALDVDVDRQTAVAPTPVAIDFGDHAAHGHGLKVDLRHDHLQLGDGGRLRLAQGARASEKSDLSLPDTFEFETLDRSSNNVWTLTRVRSITPPFVQADRARATGTDLANNRVLLEGAVRIELPKQGTLTADQATVTIRDNRLAFAHVESTSPERWVTFEHRGQDSDEIIRGRARTIDYDVPKGTLFLSGDVWFENEQGEWDVDSLDYNLLTEELRGKRNRLTLKPRRKAETLDSP